MIYEFNLGKTLESLKKRNEGVPVHYGFKSSGYPEYIEVFDKVTGGHVRGNTVLACASSGVGKTRFCMREAMQEVDAGNDVIYASFESSYPTLFKMILASLTPKGVTVEEGDKYIEQTAHYLSHIHLVDLSVGSDFKEDIYKLYKDHNTKALIIDYIDSALAEQDEDKAATAVNILRRFMTTIRKFTEKSNMFTIVCAQLNPIPDDQHIEDGLFIQGCKSLINAVDLCIAIRKRFDEQLMLSRDKYIKGNVNLNICIFKNRWGLTRIESYARYDYRRLSIYINSAWFDYDKNEPVDLSDYITDDDKVMNQCIAGYITI